MLELNELRERDAIGYASDWPSTDSSTANTEAILKLILRALSASKAEGTYIASQSHLRYWAQYGEAYNIKLKQIGTPLEGGEAEIRTTVK